MALQVSNKENEPPRIDHGKEECNQSPGAHEMFKAPTISDFVILKPISRGAFGKVFLGHKKDKADQMYAIKVMKKADMVHKNMVNQVIAERDALAASKSPFIVRLFYSLQSEQNIYLVMEYMIGGDVKSLLGVYGYFDEDMAIRYIAEVTQALEYLHNHNIIHRDLKPDNMLISAEGHIKLTDFGLSKITLNRQIGICDIVDTPCASKSQRMVNYFRTPGQVLSLTSSLAFGVKGRRKSLVSTPQYTGSWGSTNVGSPLAKDRVRASTPQFSPRPPVQALTPTLQDSLTWKSTASEQSLMDSRHASQRTRSSHEFQDVSDSVFMPYPSHHSQRTETAGVDSGAKLNEEVRFKEAARHHNVEKKRNTDSTSSNDDDTPHLHRSRQSLQESYAAQHFRNMRGEASVNPTPSNLSYERHFEKDFLRDASVSSIEVQRKQDSLAADSSLFSKMPISPDECSPDSTSKKRPFILVDKSPLRSFFSTGSHTGMTMTFEAFAIGDEHRRKRSFFQDYHASPTLRESKFRGLRSFKSRFSSSKSRKPKRTKCYSSSGLSSPGSAQGSMMYLASMSSLGSESDLTGIGALLGVLPSTAEQCKSAAVRARTKSSSSSSDMDASSPLRRQCLAKTAQPTAHTALEGQQSASELHYVQTPLGVTNLDFSMQSPGPADGKAPLNCNTSMEVNFGNTSGSEENCSFSNAQSELRSRRSVTDVDDFAAQGSPCSEITRPSSGNSLDVDLVDNANADSDIFSEPVVATPESDGLLGVHPLISGKDLFKTPSPVRQTSVSTPLNHHRTPAVDMNFELCTSQSSDDSFCLEKLFSSEDMSVSSDLGETDLDSSLNDLSLREKPQNPLRRPYWSPVERTVSGGMDTDQSKGCSPGSLVSSATTTITLTPHSDTSRNKTVRDESDAMKPKKKLLRKVTTFMSLPASSDADSCGSLYTPVAKGNLKHKRFMTPGLGRVGLTPHRTPKNIHGRRCPYNDEDTNRVLGTPDYLAPELLLQKDHTYAVDWWALGVCLYEFLTGIPPFNDVSPELVFQHILKRDLEWPEGEESLSPSARSAIENLLNPDPKTRPKSKDLKEMKLFADMDWDNLQSGEMPFVPDPDDAMDTCYFDARNEMQQLKVSAVDL